MAKKLKQEYYLMLGTNNFLFADIMKLFNINHQTLYKWIRDERDPDNTQYGHLNDFEVLTKINEHLTREGKGVSDLNELFEPETIEL